MGNAKAGDPLVSIIVGCALAMTICTPAMSGEIVGMVAQSDGRTVSGVKIVARAPDGRTSAFTSTNAQGQYRITGLEPGQYLITLEPGSTNFQQETVAAYLDGAGLTVNWWVAPGLVPLAVGHPGTVVDPTWTPPVAFSEAPPITERPKKSPKR